MAYNRTTGILTIDTANETFDVMLDNIASAINDYRVTEVAGIKARDLGLLCTSPNINKWSKHKPIRSELIPEISETDIINANFGFTPTQIDIFTTAQGGALSNYTIYKLNGDTSPWKYNVPRGKSNEYTEWFRVKDFNGYYSRAKNFLSSPMSSENNLSQTHSIFTPNYKYDESSVNNSGSYADIDIMLSKLNFKVVDSQMPNIGESSIYTYRIALAIKVQFVSGINSVDGYLIASSIKPLGQVDSSNPFEYYIDLVKVSDILKKIARQQEKNTFECIPFIAYDLKYSEDKHFYWGGTVNQKAFPFPNNDRCQLKLTGFPYKVIGSTKSFSIKINGTNFTPNNYVIENGAFYYIFTDIPKTVNTVQLTISYAITSGFGVMSNWEMGLMGYYQATPDIINQSDSEWEDEEKIYTFTANDTNAPSGLTTAASNQMQYLDTPMNLRYTNSQKLGIQNAIEPNKVMIRFVFVK